MFRRLMMAAMALAAAGVASSAQAEDRWVLMDKETVDVSKDRATVDVTKAKGKYRAVRINSREGDIVLSRIQVLYANGAVHNEERVINLNEGERTRPINQGKEDRFVDQVNLTITPAKSGKVKLEIYGLQSDDGADAKRPAGSAPVAANTPPPATTVDTAPTKPVPTKTDPGKVTEYGDVLFGSQYVGFGVDRDVIRVGAEIGKFDKVRLRVLDNDIFIKDLKVVYANGEAQDLVVNADVKKDSRTQWFDLKGDRFIKEVQMVYKSKPSFKGQARIEVLGQYAEGWLGPSGEGRKFNQGWVLLGAQTAGFIGFDRDVIPVGKNEGGFKKLRLTVKDRAITLSELRVIYGNGQEDVIPVKAKVEAGSTYGPIELKGGTRTIKEVQARYRSRFIDREARGKGMAIVEVWGQH
jgi:Protein of unknown function (DUF2541)